MATAGRGSLDGGKRSKLQLLVHLAQNKLTAGGVRLNEDQVDTLSLALSECGLQCWSGPACVRLRLLSSFRPSPARSSAGGGGRGRGSQGHAPWHVAP